MRAVKETPVGDMRMSKRRSPQGAFGDDRFLLCFGQIRCKCGRRDPLNPGARLPHTSLKNAPPIRSIGGAYPFMDTRTPIRKSIPVGVSLFVSGCFRIVQPTISFFTRTGANEASAWSAIPVRVFFYAFFGERKVFEKIFLRTSYKPKIIAQ